MPISTDQARRNASARYAGGEAPSGPVSRISCPRKIAKALQAYAAAHRLPASAVTAEAITSYLAAHSSPEESGNAAE